MYEYCCPELFPILIRTTHLIVKLCNVTTLDDLCNSGTCYLDQTQNEYGIFVWPMTSHSTVASLPCPYGSVLNWQVAAYARRSCTVVKGAILWDTPDVSDCLKVSGSCRRTWLIV